MPICTTPVPLALLSRSTLSHLYRATYTSLLWIAHFAHLPTGVLVLVWLSGKNHSKTNSVIAVKNANFLGQPTCPCLHIQVFLWHFPTLAVCPGRSVLPAALTPASKVLSPSPEPFTSTTHLTAPAHLAAFRAVWLSHQTLDLASVTPHSLASQGLITIYNDSFEGGPDLDVCPAHGVRHSVKGAIRVFCSV